MADIREFAGRAAEQFCASQQHIRERFNLGLPRPVVEEYVKAVFYASMIPDEGRYPRVCLMCYRKGCEPDFHLLFSCQIQPSAEEIAKLAQAVATGSHVCCICDNGKIQLGGIHVTTLNEMREFGYSSSRVANPLKMLIRGPGHIEMSTGGTALIYKAGEITEENVFQYSDVMTALAVSVKGELAGLTSGTVEALDDIFNDLAEGIVRLGHGGILLVAKEPQRKQFSSLRQIDCLLLQQLLIRYWNDVATYLAARHRVASMPADARAGVVNPHALTVASDTAMLEKCIDSIAHLTGMDGAVVLNYACKVAAFNAIIDRSASSPNRRLVDQYGRELRREDVVGNRGSRHQAALSYAMNVSNAFAFVISQDGGVSAFYNLGDGRVVCEMGMRVQD
jgi:DisA bacterial checkpoint controller nucleotide-binding